MAGFGIPHTAGGNPRGFHRAIKRNARLRCALFGPAGSGKTFSSLAIAAGIGGRVALIDSERGSAEKYADRFEFDAASLQARTVDEYVRCIVEAGDAGYGVLIIDSLTHAWQELCSMVEKLAKARYHGNTWAAWAEGTPEQRRLVDAISLSRCHVIATMRTKTEWITSDDGAGKKKPVRVGLAPEQGKGIEYEFDMLMEISQDHIASVTKDRSGRFQDLLIERPGAEFGRQLAEWLDSGLAAEQVADPAQVDPIGDQSRRAGSTVVPEATFVHSGAVKLESFAAASSPGGETPKRSPEPVPPQEPPHAVGPGNSSARVSAKEDSPAVAAARAFLARVPATLDKYGEASQEDKAMARDLANDSETPAEIPNRREAGRQVRLKHILLEMSRGSQADLARLRQYVQRTVEVIDEARSAYPKERLES